MLYYVSLQDHVTPYLSFRANVGEAIRDLRHLSYERLFRARRAPYGHYIFTDIDRLSHYEKEIVIVIADALRAVDPAPRVLNDPRDVLDRYPLLKMLEREGVNRFTATRLDDGARPTVYPVFIRCEDSHHATDTDLLHSAAELEEAIEQLRRQGKVLKRRIAIGYCGQRDADGFFRKYSVHYIDGHLIPHHIVRGDQWQVRGRSELTKGEEHARAETEFARENPHRELLAKVFRLAHIDFGRVDYGLVDGAVQVYEINTNPHFPRNRRRQSSSSAAREERRALTEKRLVDATRSVNVALPKRRAVAFELPQPLFHHMRPWAPRRVLIAGYRRFLQEHPQINRLVPSRFW
jgi:hypothetical protein